MKFRLKKVLVNGVISYFQIDQVVKWSTGEETYIFQGKMIADDKHIPEELERQANEWFEKYLTATKESLKKASSRHQQANKR